MKEAVTKVIDTLTQEDFHGSFQKLLERYNKYIAAGGDYFEGELSFMCVLSIKVPIQKKYGNLFNDPRRCCGIRANFFNQLECWYCRTIIGKTSLVPTSKFLWGIVAGIIIQVKFNFLEF